MSISTEEVITKLQKEKSEIMDDVNDLIIKIEQLQKDNKAKQEVIDKLAVGLSEAADALEGCAEYELNSIGKKSQALINSKGEDDGELSIRDELALLTRNDLNHEAVIRKAVDYIEQLQKDKVEMRRESLLKISHMMRL